MEKFSNHRGDYWKRIEAELKSQDTRQAFIFHYIEMGALFQHGFSFCITKENPRMLIGKIWKAEFDNLRFRHVFNLDRLAIKEFNIELSAHENSRLNTLLKSELALSNWEGIVLDGLACEFQFGEQLFKWNSNEEINTNLLELVSLLRNKASNYI
ncbi:MAG: hypothetical protein AAF487_07175 [Bacteroidota bacterium]